MVTDRHICLCGMFTHPSPLLAINSDYQFPEMLSQDEVLYPQGPGQRRLRTQNWSL